MAPRAAYAPILEATIVPAQSVAQRLSPTEDAFGGARAAFERLVGRFSSRETMKLTHSDLERLVETEGREVLRQLLQDHLDLRGPGDAAEPVVGADDVERTHRRVHTRPLETVVGEVEVTRAGYGKRGLESLHPLDAELNLPDEKYSLGVRQRVAELCAKQSFDEVTSQLARTSGAEVAKRQVEELALRAAADFDAFYRARTVPSPKETGPILVITTDGKGVRMRQEDLRPATRKVAATRRRRLDKRLAPGEKRGRKRMAQVAAVYTIAPFVRTPDEVMGELAPDGGAQAKRPRPEAKRVWASIEAPAGAVIDAAFDEAERRDPERKKTWALLCDGSDTQLLDLCRSEYLHGVEATVILDVIHVAEYLWKASPAFETSSSPAAEAWVRERLLEILRGKAVHVAAGMRRSATLRGLTATARAPVDDCAGYLLKYQAFMRYDEYLARGLPIATGVIEGACRYLVKDRMDLTGASWRLGGAEAVLRLRSLWASGDFDEYWAFHERQEFERNHAARFAGPAPKVIKPQLSRDGRRSRLGLVP